MMGKNLKIHKFVDQRTVIILPPQKTESNIFFNDFQMEQIRNQLVLEKYTNTLVFAVYYLFFHFQATVGPHYQSYVFFYNSVEYFFFAKLYIILAFSIINYSFPQANILANVKKIKFILFDGNHSFLQIMHQTATCFFIDIGR